MAAECPFLVPPVPRERVWLEQSVTWVSPVTAVPTGQVWHHEWWDEVQPRLFVQRHEEVTLDEAMAVYARLGESR